MDPCRLATTEAVTRKPAKSAQGDSVSAFSRSSSGYSGVRADRADFVVHLLTRRGLLACAPGAAFAEFFSAHKTRSIATATCPECRLRSTAIRDLGDVASFARAAMLRHGLAGWTFAFDRAIQSLGTCSDSRRQITLSAVHAQGDPIDDVTDTILHEIAHALTPGHGHDAVWKAKASELGATPTAHGRSPSLDRLKSRWVGTCPVCGARILRHRRQHASCADCSERYDERYRFVWTLNDRRRDV